MYVGKASYRVVSDFKKCGLKRAARRATTKIRRTFVGSWQTDEKEII